LKKYEVEYDERYVWDWWIFLGFLLFRPFRAWGDLFSFKPMGCTHRWDISPFQGWDFEKIQRRIRREVCLGLIWDIWFGELVSPFQGFAKSSFWLFIDGLHPSLRYFALSGLLIMYFALSGLRFKKWIDGKPIFKIIEMY
jgi:hypothetical protein